MNLFNRFIKKQQDFSKNKLTPNKDNYQPDSYYSSHSYKGTLDEKKVVTFEERKKTATPSANGLYPAEILLLYYVSLRIYPNPKNGYPGFWWFEYGIRHVEEYLTNLEQNNYIIYDLYKNQLSHYTVPQLKSILSSKNLSTTGKKSELLQRISQSFNEDELHQLNLGSKYILTEKGKKELDENAYVPYMHQNPQRTIENNPFGEDFTVWSINKELSKTNSKWKELVKKYEANH